MGKTVRFSYIRPMGWIRAFFRLLYFAFMAIATLLAYFIVSIFKGLDMNRALKYRRWYVKGLIRFLGIQLDIQGPFPKVPGLIISNHRSYIDPAIVLYDVLAFPIAKMEVSKWPIVGAGAKATGVIYVERSNKSSRRQTRTAAIEKILDGFHVLVYPEGTTHIDPTTIEFRKGTFVEAAKHNIPIYPVAIEYLHKSDAWIGTDTFLRHFFECFAKPHTPVKLRYGPVIHSTDPENSAQTAQNWIDQSLLSLREEWKEEKLLASSH